jgi:hypothetical protein
VKSSRVVHGRIPELHGKREGDHAISKTFHPANTSTGQLPASYSRHLCCPRYLRPKTVTRLLKKRTTPQTGQWRPRRCTELAPAVAIATSSRFRHRTCGTLNCDTTTPLHHVSVSIVYCEACSRASTSLVIPSAYMRSSLE